MPSTLVCDSDATRLEYIRRYDVHDSLIDVLRLLLEAQDGDLLSSRHRAWDAVREILSKGAI